MKTVRQYSLSDKWIMAFDHGVRTVFKTSRHSTRANPATDVEDEKYFTESQRKKSAALMRVNHTGEICAQALYDGQALSSRNPDVKAKLEEAAAEEQDHLAWCEQRLQELNSRTSYLNPLWYAGSFMIGVCAGVAGDQWNLGFVAETEHQVLKHLNNHLSRLPKADKRSEEILKQMSVDEEKHATTAINNGARPLPSAVKRMMSMTSKLMTTLTYWI